MSVDNITRKRGAIDFDRETLRRTLFLKAIYREIGFQEERRMATWNPNVIRVFGCSPKFEEFTPGEPTPRYTLEIVPDGKTKVKSVKVRRVCDENQSDETNTG